METVRLLIADDQTISRRSLISLLAAHVDIEVIGEVGNGQEAIELAVSLQPDVILINLRMPGINGTEATRRIHRVSPHIAILVLMVFGDDTSVFPAIRAGARGYQLKNTDQEELLWPIETVSNGEAIFSPGIAQRVSGYLKPEPHLPKNVLDELTLRECQILELVAQGKTNSEIASNLITSSKTGSNNVSNVLLKVQAADRAKLMLRALEAGMGQERLSA